MKKKVLKICLLNFPIGIAIGYVITILISLIGGDGHYYACVPTLVETVGSEIGAVVLQTLLCGFISSATAAASFIWRTDWSIVKQTGLHFLALAVILLPIAWICHWMEHTWLGFLIYSGIFTVLFAIIWMIQYGVWKHRLKAINKKMQEK